MRLTSEKSTQLTQKPALKKRGQPPSWPSVPPRSKIAPKVARDADHTGPTWGLSALFERWFSPGASGVFRSRTHGSRGPLSRGSRYDCARADLSHRLTSIYASSEAIFTHPTFHLHLLLARKARGAFQFIFRFRYCSRVAGIRHATYVYIWLGRNVALFLIYEPGAARTRLFFGGVWPGP